MKPKIGKIDKLSIVVVLVMAFALLSSFLDFGSISVLFSVTIPLLFIVNFGLALYGLFKKQYLYSLGIIIFLLGYNFFFQFSRHKTIATKNTISFLTYNVRSFEQPVASNINTSTEIIKFIDSINPDIVAFQEYGYKKGKKLESYPYVFLGYRPDITKSLLTIHSKYPIIKKGHIDFPDTRNNAIYADIKIENDTIRVYNVHLQSYVVKPKIKNIKNNKHNYWNSLNTTISKQIEQVKLVKNHTSKSNNKIIICGDFNATPFSQTYRLMKKDFNDSFLSKGNGFGTTYSHSKYPLRLDYFLYKEQLKVVNHKNFNLNLSDHEPVLIRFKNNLE